MRNRFVLAIERLERWCVKNSRILFIIGITTTILHLITTVLRFPLIVYNIEILQLLSVIVWFLLLIGILETRRT